MVLTTGGGWGDCNLEDRRILDVYHLPLRNRSFPRRNYDVDMQPLLLTDIGLFIGRFHPLLVHLPIGFLLLAVALEWWPGDKARLAIQTSWVLGAMSAVAAAVCGWLLARESGGGDTLFWHRWLGVSVAVLAAIGIIVAGRGGMAAKGYGLLVALLLGLAGHQGGNLTHGEKYLFEHAPPVVQKIAGHAPDTTANRDWSEMNYDSINLYSNFLQPAIDETCAKCHNDQKQNGDLRMDAPHYVFVGGDGGPIVAAGAPFSSTWLKRVTLPRSNVKAMPPQGDPWNYAQVELLKYWLAEGADTLFVLSPTETPDEIKELLRRDYELDLRPRLFVETVNAPKLEEEMVEALSQLNWSVSPLRPEGGAIEVKPKPGQELRPEALAKLAEGAPDQVVYLSLDNEPMRDGDLEPLTKFKNLNRLRLNGTQLTAATVERLKSMPNLESLNLYGTEVDDAIFAHLDSYPQLKRLYLWQTKVTPEAVEKYASAHPNVTVDTGFKPEPTVSK